MVDVLSISVRRVALLLTVCAGFLAGAALVPQQGAAALHNVQGFEHGIISPPGYNCISNGSWCRARNYDVDNNPSLTWMNAGMYHYKGASGWNEQCHVSSSETWLWIECDGPSGTAPCQKYAWTDGWDQAGGSLQQIAWHGHNPAACI